MIKVDDLVRWAREHAVGKTITVLGGWIGGKDLLALARDVNKKEPFDYLLKINKETE